MRPDAFTWPDELVARARRFYQQGGTPVTPRLAATVVLLRDTAAGVTAYLLRRPRSMTFAAGMYVFPGGAVDSVDRLGDQAGEVPEGMPLAVETLGQALRDIETAHAVVRAAVRETAEEAGVRLEAARLVPWARWITPEFEPRRYDTFFFLAALPSGRRTRRAAAEADQALWIAPERALARYRRGRMPMLPPTVMTLTELASHRSVVEALAAGWRRDLTPVLPRIDINDIDIDR